MIIPVKKTLNSAGHIDAKLIDFSEICQKNPAKSAVFYWLFLGEVSPPKFPMKSADFSKNLPRKSFEIWLFSAKIPRNRPIFCEFCLFSRQIPRNRLIFPRVCPWKSRKILLFFPRNIRSPVYNILHSFFSVFIKSKSGLKNKQFEITISIHSRQKSGYVIR